MGLVPTYVFFNPHTGVEWEEFMSISKRERFLESHPHIEQRLTAPNVISGARVSTGKLGGFKEVLQKVGEGHPGSAVDKQHNRRTAKQVATDKVAKKHGIKKNV
tara:strand:- start:11 stop:322 length:312 start_codon:yes stop_codon:yes gene_type:complete